MYLNVEKARKLLKKKKKDNTRELQQCCFTFLTDSDLAMTSLIGLSSELIVSASPACPGNMNDFFLLIRVKNWAFHL
jgi:hypothetical protein